MLMTWQILDVTVDARFTRVGDKIEEMKQVQGGAAGSSKFCKFLQVQQVLPKSSSNNRNNNSNINDTINNRTTRRCKRSRRVGPSCLRRPTRPRHRTSSLVDSEDTCEQHYCTLDAPRSFSIKLASIDDYAVAGNATRVVLRGLRPLGRRSSQLLVQHHGQQQPQERRSRAHIIRRTPSSAKRDLEKSSTIRQAVGFS